PVVFLNRFDHVRMVADDEFRAGVDGGMCEALLILARLRHVLDASMHRNNHDIAALLQRLDILLDLLGVEERDALVDVLIIAVRLIVGISEKTELDSVTFEDLPLMHILAAGSAANGDDVMVF